MTLTETGKSPASGVALTEGRVVVQSLNAPSETTELPSIIPAKAGIQ